MATYTEMVEGVEPWFFEVLPMEFCLQFRLVPVQVDDREIQILGWAPIDPNVLLYIERISGRSVVPIPVEVEKEDILVGFLSVLCRNPEVLATTERSEGELLSVIQNPPVWGPTCWERVRRINLALSGEAADGSQHAWLSVLPSGVLSVSSWEPFGRSGWEARLRVDERTKVQINPRGDQWVVSLSTHGEAIQSIQFSVPDNPDWPGDEGMSSGTSAGVGVASLQKEEEADELGAEMEALLDAIRRPARVFALPPGRGHRHGKSARKAAKSSGVGEKREGKGIWRAFPSHSLVQVRTRDVTLPDHPIALPRAT